MNKPYVYSMSNSISQNKQIYAQKNEKNWKRVLSK